LTRPGGESAEGSTGARFWRSWCRIIEVSVQNWTISQIQTEDFGHAQTLYLLLVSLCFPLVPILKPIVLLQCSCSTTKVEKQLKRLNIPYSHVYSSSPLAAAAHVNAVRTVTQRCPSAVCSRMPSQRCLYSRLTSCATLPRIMRPCQTFALSLWRGGRTNTKCPKVVTCVK
jgi:hypothetical protein